MTRSSRITLIHQNDTHAHIDPHWELCWRAGVPEVWRAGGYAHIGAIASRIRKEKGGACLHVDSGDAIHGTGPAQWTKGAVVIPPLNAVGVEVMTPGNWEFGFGPSVLRERTREMSFPVVASNVFRAETGDLEFGASVIKEVGGRRVALIGITSPIVSRTMPQAFGSGLRFADALDVLPGIVSAIRDAEQPDITILISHYGFAQEVAIARAVDGIDVILGGHTHDVLATPAVVGRTIITQSGAHGSYLTRLDLDLTHRSVSGFAHTLIPVTAEGEADDSIAALVEEGLRPHRDAIDEVVGETSVLLHRGTVFESPMDNLITRAYIESTGADVAISHGWRYGTPVPPGPITAGDLWQMIPTNPELFTIQLTGSELQRMLEKSIERTFAGNTLQQQGGYVMRFAGMRAVVRLNNPAGFRVQHLEVGSSPVSSESRYTVAAAGEQSVEKRGGRSLVGIRAVDSLRAYLASHRPADTAITHRSLVSV